MTSVFSNPDCTTDCPSDLYKVLDLTTGQKYSQTDSCYFCAAYPFAISWLDSQYDGNITVPDFGKIRFIDFKATPYNDVGSKPLTARYWNTVEQYVLHGQESGKVTAQPSAMTSTSKSSSFTNTWERGQ